LAEATSEQDCIDRHVDYPIDITSRVEGNGRQRQRIPAMASMAEGCQSVLDVGCNAGYMADFLPNVPHVGGVDVAPALVAKARAKGMDAHVAPAEHLPFEAKSWDAVILGEILEHVYDPVVALQEAARVARQRVIISTPHYQSKWGPDGPKKPDGHPFHVRCFTVDELIAACEAAGLTVQSCFGMPYPFPQFWIVKAAV
jgi:SAM-dependent methyltransferase